MDTSELAGRCGNTFPVNWGSIKRKPVIEWAIIACSIAANMGGYLTCLLNGCVPLQTQLRTILDKQTETGQEWFKPTEPSGTIHLCGFFFFLPLLFYLFFWGYTWGGWNRFQHTLSRCLGHPACTISLYWQLLMPPTSPSIAGKSETVGCDAKYRSFIVP